MKKILFTLTLLSFILQAHSQITFEKIYNYWTMGEVQVVFQEEDGYVLAGDAVNVVNDVYHSYLIIIKTNLYGDTLWVKEIDYGVGSVHLEIKATTEDEFGNKYFALSLYNDSANFIKFDSQYNIVWKKILDNYYMIKNLFMSSDGNIVTVGHNDYNSNYQMDIYYLTKFDINGKILWTSPPITYQKYGRLEFPTFIELPDSKIVVVANWWDGTYYITKPSVIRTYSATGDPLSSVVFNPQSQCSSIIQSVLLGDELISLCKNYIVPTFPYFIRHHTDGSIVEENMFETPSNIYKFVMKDNNTIITCGYGYISNSFRLYLNGFSINGDSLWSSFVGNSKWKHIKSMKLNLDGGILIAGRTSRIDTSIYSYGLPYMALTDSFGRIIPLNLTENIISTVKVFPNPARGTVVFETTGNQSCTMILYDATGRVCEEMSLSAGRTVFNTGNLQHGVYIYSIISNDHKISGKLIITGE